jgi:predicted TIM-barrel fold metal-dependent hydrolase
MKTKGPVLLLSALLAAGAGCTAMQENQNLPHLALPAETPAIYSGPVIDVHLHAAPASANGPPPMAVCIGTSVNLRYDPATPWEAAMVSLMKAPPCDAPIWGPETDEEVRDQTIEVMRRLNIRGILSESPERVKAWQEAAPDLFIPGRTFNLRWAAESPDELRQAFMNGDFAVLGEVTNQYAGFLADDPAFDAYWALAEELDIPVGIHLGVGPPGTPALTGGAYRLQSARQIESVMARHPGLRVYMMHAGYPYAAETKAMLYAYPQLHVDTGVLQMAVARADYYAFLEDLVRGGFEDRIMFGSDQMNWPGLIEEGINAINEAPFLTYEQKKAILHDNAVRFFRLEQ